MPQFHYARFDKSWGIESKVDESTYIAARDMYAECFGLIPTMLEYLLQYGVNQTTQDSGAQPVAACKESGDDPKAAFIAAADKRWDKIVAGTVSIRAGGSRSQFDTILRDVIDEYLAKWATGKGEPLPKKQADLEPLRAKMYGSKNKTAIDAEVAARKARGDAIEVDDFDE